MLPNEEYYLVTFTDEAGIRHTIYLAKKEGGNKKVNALLRALNEIGFEAGKYIPVTH